MEEFCKQLKIINDALEKILYLQFEENNIKYPIDAICDIETGLAKATNWVAKQKEISTPPIVFFNNEIDHILESGYKWS